MPIRMEFLRWSSLDSDGFPLVRNANSDRSPPLKLSWFSFLFRGKKRDKQKMGGYKRSKVKEREGWRRIDKDKARFVCCSELPITSLARIFLSWRRSKVTVLWLFIVPSLDTYCLWQGYRQICTQKMTMLNSYRASYLQGLSGSTR
jgi:hypothetical protein